MREVRLVEAAAEKVADGATVEKAAARTGLARVAAAQVAAAMVVVVTAASGGGAGVVQTEVEGARGSRQDAAVAEVEPVGEEVGV